MCVNVISPDDSHDSLFLSNFVTTQIKDDLSRVKGVGDVVIWGARDFSRLFCSRFDRDLSLPRPARRETDLWCTL